jgi:hypothetical protein
VFKPANGETAVIRVQPTLVATISVNLLKRTMMSHRADSSGDEHASGGNGLASTVQDMDTREPGEEDDSDYEPDRAASVDVSKARRLDQDDLADAGAAVAKKPHLLRGVMIIKDKVRLLYTYC